MNVAEFGVATGGCSVVPLEVIIDTVREKYPHMKFSIFLNDLLENRFEVAIKFIQEGLKRYEGVYIYTAPSDFSIQVFPENFIDISFSNFSLHILPFVPGPLEENVVFTADADTEREEWAKPWIVAFRKHLKQFFESRLKELQVKGVFFAITLSAAEDKEILNI